MGTAAARTKRVLPWLKHDSITSFHRTIAFSCLLILIFVLTGDLIYRLLKHGAPDTHSRLDRTNSGGRLQQIELFFFTFHRNQPGQLESWIRHHSSVLRTPCPESDAPRIFVSARKTRKNACKQIARGGNMYHHLHVIDHKSDNLYAQDILHRAKILGVNVRHFSGPYMGKARQLSRWMRELRHNEKATESSKRSGFLRLLVPLDVDEYFIITGNLWNNAATSHKMKTESVDISGMRKTFMNLNNNPHIFEESNKNAAHASERRLLGGYPDGAHEDNENTFRQKESGRVMLRTQMMSPYMARPCSEPTCQGFSTRPVNTLASRLTYVDWIRPIYHRPCSCLSHLFLVGDIQQYFEAYVPKRRATTNFTGKAMFDSKYFISTDQGNHFGTVATDFSDMLRVLKPEKNQRNGRGSKSRTAAAALFHLNHLSWQNFKTKVLRAASEYNFSHRIGQNGRCAGYGEHLCLEYKHNYLQNSKSFVLWRKRRFSLFLSDGYLTNY
jgi:hypothetical protein